MIKSVTNGWVFGVDGTKIHFERTGGGETVALCDGLGCDGFVWKYLKEALLPTFSPLHYHYPGHGLSGIPGPGADLSPSRLADDLISVLDHCGIRRAVVVGHSLGVQVALETAHRYPSRVLGLALISGVHRHLIQSIDHRSMLRFVIPALSVAELLFPSRMTGLAKGLPSGILSRIALMTSAINARLMRQGDMEAYFQGLKSADLRTVVRTARFAAAYDATPYLSDLKLPVLIMGGRLDLVTPPALLAETAALIPNAEITVTRHGTHALPVEQPDFVSLRLLRFLEERVFVETISE